VSGSSFSCDLLPCSFTSSRNSGGGEEGGEERGEKGRGVGEKEGGEEGSNQEVHGSSYIPSQVYTPALLKKVPCSFPSIQSSSRAMGKAIGKSTTINTITILG